MHKRGRSPKPLPPPSPPTEIMPFSEPPEEDHVIGHWLPVKERRQQQQQQQLQNTTADTCPASFEISTWGDEWTAPNSNNHRLDTDRPCSNEWADDHNKSPEIGVWNGNALDLSHLKEMPVFTINIDASISEKSTDILTWIQHRYGEPEKFFFKFHVRIFLYF